MLSIYIFQRAPYLNFSIIIICVQQYIDEWSYCIAIIMVQYRKGTVGILKGVIIMDFTDTTIMDENEVVAETTTEFSDPAKDELVYLPIEKLYPHPDNPRKELGDLTELADNIKQTRKILQNLVVVEWPDEVSGEMRYRIIAGHRRRAAAEIAGLTELPCVIVDLTPEEQIEAMMNENVHRKNLNIIEQAQGFQLMLENVGSVEEVSRRTGFSRSTVSNRVKYTRLDQEMK